MNEIVNSSSNNEIESSSSISGSNEATVVSNTIITSVEQSENDVLLALEKKKKELMLAFLEENNSQTIVIQEKATTTEFENNDNSSTTIITETDTMIIDNSNNNLLETNETITMIHLKPNFDNMKAIIKSSNDDNNNQSGKDNFLKGIKFSPDGTCILSCSEDNYLKLFELPSQEYIEQQQQTNEIIDIKPILNIKEYNTIYDYCWYPNMNSMYQETCCFLSSSSGVPMHLYDAFTGVLRGSYIPFKDVDDIETAYSVQFNQTGTKIYSGFKKSIKIFDINRPGNDYDVISTYKKKKRKLKGNYNDEYNDLELAGIVSCISFDKACNTGLFAAATYNGNLGLFDEKSNQLVDLIPFPKSMNNNSNVVTGITQIMFSPLNGNYVFASYRKSNVIVGWDIRNTVAEQVYQFHRSLDTHQRMTFDIDPYSGRYLTTGSQDGDLHIYDLFEPEESKQLVQTTRLQNSSVNGTSFHPFLPLLATSFGERSFNIKDDECDHTNNNSIEQQQDRNRPNKLLEVFKFEIK
ncbi:hypothetical protein CYY_005089 [Polysphondylium violaceum]|uniref:WD40 repeat-containing protein n=1 Tax=Polysphondylium violaceum TaxID=133409 RepID=A0A8J4PU28_9MYCE|nr:hypothetical protein CYY_005089 [Polysphondylium violaceum]